MKKANEDIRAAIKNAGIRHYHVAKQMGMKASNFSILLRFELSGEVKNEVLKAVEVAAKQYV